MDFFHLLRLVFLIQPMTGKCLHISKVISQGMDASASVWGKSGSFPYKENGWSGVDRRDNSLQIGLENLN